MKSKIDSLKTNNAKENRNQELSDRQLSDEMIEQVSGGSEIVTKDKTTGERTIACYA